MGLKLFGYLELVEKLEVLNRFDSIVRKYNARLKGNNCTEVKFFFKEIIRRDNIRE